MREARSDELTNLITPLHFAVVCDAASPWSLLSTFVTIRHVRITNMASPVACLSERHGEKREWDGIENYQFHYI